MKACIVLNGEVRDYEFLKSNFQNNKYDFIICADGGAKHLYKINIIPDYIIGDLDSLNSEIISFYKENKGLLPPKLQRLPCKARRAERKYCRV